MDYKALQIVLKVILRDAVWIIYRRWYTPQRWKRTVKPQEHSRHPLRAPVSGAMVRTIHEHPPCKVFYCFEENGTPLLELDAQNAAFEYEYWGKTSWPSLSFSKIQLWEIRHLTGPLPCFAAFQKINPVLFHPFSKSAILISVQTYYMVRWEI